MKTLEELSAEEWGCLMALIPNIGEEFSSAIRWNDRNQGTDQNERIYRVKSEEKSVLLKVSQIHYYNNLKGKPEPITIKWSGGPTFDIYSAVFFDDPENDGDIKTVNLGTGLFQGKIDHLVDKLTPWGVPSQLWPWSDTDIYIDVEKGDAELWYHGIDARTPGEAVTRDFGLQLYKVVLRVLDMDEGLINHSYPDRLSPRLIDTGSRVSKPCIML
tara:strand:+ start:1284 stop:1928 length:645 start_codon:yes stop_codon:yes gene_type:complete